MTMAEEIAWALIETADNIQSSNEEIRALTAEWVGDRWRRYEWPRMVDCQEVGEEIREYVRNWYGMLAKDEMSFPGGLLSRFLSMTDWATVGKFYLDDYIENR